MSRLALIAATNEPSHALLHGSEVCDLPATRTGSAPIAGWLQVVAFAFSLACRFTPPHVLIIAALTLLASPLFAQQPLPAGIGDGWIAEIREARADLKEHREAIAESAAESKRWRTWINSDEPGPVSKFLDRIGNGLLLICGTIAFVGLCLAPFGVAMLVREMRRQVA